MRQCVLVAVSIGILLFWCRPIGTRGWFFVSLSNIAYYRHEAFLPKKTLTAVVLQQPAAVLSGSTYSCNQLHAAYYRCDALLPMPPVFFCGRSWMCVQGAMIYIKMTACFSFGTMHSLFAHLCNYYLPPWDVQKKVGKRNLGLVLQQAISSW